MTTAPPSTSSPSDKVDPNKPLIVYAIPGSQYVFKVLAPLQAYHVPHYVHFVPMSERERTKVLPSGGKLVPQLTHGSLEEKTKKEDRTNIGDSEAILEYLFDQGILPYLYPTDATHTLSQRVSDGTLAAMVWHYNWIDPHGHSASIRAFVGQQTPWFVPLWLLDSFVLKKSKVEYRERVLKALSKTQDHTDITDSDLDDASKMKEILLKELAYLNSQFVDDNQIYLIANNADNATTPEPTAADFSAYALMERLVGGQVDPPSSDAALPAALPHLVEETATEFPKLWKWHHHMRTTYRVQFKGRRLPKDLLSKL